MDTNNQGQSDQFLSFSLRGENFAIEISKVREVLDLTTMTRIPRMPEYLCGVINLRGNVVPVTDLGFKLGMKPVERTINTCVMIVEVAVEGESENIQMGVVTDSVQEVLDLTKEETLPTPNMGTNIDTEFIKGIGKKRDEFLILLDIDKILTSDDQISQEELHISPTQTQSGHKDESQVAA